MQFGSREFEVQMSSRVSIVMASYNSQEYVSAAIESVQAQSYTDWELFVIDDSSTDGTTGVVQSYVSADSRIELLVNDSNMGPGHTRNRGIEKAEGRFLTFIDSDDLWEPTFLETSVRTIIDSGCPFVFASYNRCDEELSPVMEPFIVPGRVTYKDLLHSCPISCLTAVLDIGQIGKYFMPPIRKRQDYVLWLTILKDIPEAKGIRDVLATYRMRKGSVSRNKVKAMYYIWRVYREHERFNVFKSTYLLGVYAINGLVKYSS